MALTISKEQLQASICEDSFYEFLKYFWDTIIPEDPVYNWHVKYLCDELQKMAERVFAGEHKEYDLIINIPPGSTKSTICSVMFPAWVWTRMPTARMICGSYAHMLSLNLSRLSRIVVQSEKYTTLWPDFCLTSDQNTKGYFVTNAGGGRLATGTGGSITGFHAHFILVDDPIDPNAAMSEADLKSSNNWMRETLPTRKVDKALTPIILIMQRIHQDDPTGSRLERSDGTDVKHICLPAELSKNVSPKILRKRYIDGLLDPVRLSAKILKENKSELGEFGYAGQFGQDPIPRGGGMFKTHCFKIIHGINPANIVDIVRYWDKAGSQDRGCYTVGAKIAKLTNGRFTVLDVVRGQWSSEIRESKIKQTAEMDGINVRIGLEQEGGSGGKESAEATIRNLAGYRVFLDRPTGDKVFRADPYSVQVNIENVDLMKGEWNQEYINELSFFPHGKYKDQVDASSGAFNSLTAKKKVIKVGR